MNLELKALREESAKAAADARSLRDQFNKDRGSVANWTQEDHQAFDRAIGLATDLADKLQRATSTADNFSRLDRLDTPVNAVQTGAVERSAANDPSKIEAHKSAQRLWMQGDVHGAERVLRDAGHTNAEVHSLISGDGSKGGFLVAPDFSNRVLERMAAVSISRGLVQLVPTNSNELVYPRIAANSGTYPTVYGSGFAGDWDTEQGSTTEASGTVTVKAQQTQPTAEQVRIPVNNWVPNPVIASMSLLEDAPAAEQIIARQIGTTFGLDIDYAVLSGTGVARPQGILTEATAGNITTVNSGASAGLTYGGLLDLVYGLPAQYANGAAAVMKRATFGAALKLETGSGTTLVFPNNAAPTSFFGYNTQFSDFMPAHSTGDNLAVIFGNFAEGYVLVERSGLRIQRLVERYAPNVGFSPVARIGGGVVLPEAFRVLKIHS